MTKKDNTTGSIKAYKGFNKDMTCSPNGIPFQYKEGETYHEDAAVMCESGFHACTMPLDCFRYYQPSKSVYHEVELEDVADKRSNDSKVVGKTIKIGAEIGIPGLVKAQIEYTKQLAADTGNSTSGFRSSAATSGEESSAATSGFRSSAATSGNGSSAATSGEESSAATSGFRSSAATSGFRSSAATSGFRSSAATSGFRSSAATSGEESSAATSGEESSAATSGDWSSAATSGFRSSAATSGNGSSAATSGEESSAATNNHNGIVLANGKNSRVKGVIGSYLVATEWSDDSAELLCAKMERVDGERIKADTWYVLKGGEFAEWENENETL